jgi:hypothetical protein
MVRERLLAFRITAARTHTYLLHKQMLTLRSGNAIEQ